MMKRAGTLLLILFAVAAFSLTAEAPGNTGYSLIYEDDQGLIWTGPIRQSDIPGPGQMKMPNALHRP